MSENKVEFSYINSLVESLVFKFQRVDQTTVTGCWAFLPNGFQVGYGESACVDPSNFDFELGKKYAQERCVLNATNELWKLEGYLLKIKGTTSDYIENPLSKSGKSMTFGSAIHYLKEGHKVQRVGWNGKGMWLKFIDPYNNTEFTLHEKTEMEVGTFAPYIGMNTADNQFVPWLASQTDMLAEDWELVSIFAL